MSIDACVAWALEQSNRLKYMNGTGLGISLRELKPVPEFISDRRKEIIAPFPNAEIEPESRDYLLILQPGQCVFRHVDGVYENRRHIRLNWVLSAPEKGGEIYFDLQCMRPEVDGVYLIDSTVPHHVATVLGKKPMILISFGLLIKEPINV